MGGLVNHVCKNFGCVALGFDVVPGLLDFSISADEVGAARNSLEGTAHEFLKPPGSVRLNHFVRGITQQREIQFLLGLEAGKRLGRIGADAKDYDSGFVELRACVTKLGRFDCST